MTRERKKGQPISGKGTPSESDRRVLERTREEKPEDDSVDNEAGQEPVDLSLHGDDVEHWRDELPSKRNARREREGKIPPGKTNR